MIYRVLVTGLLFFCIAGVWADEDKTYRWEDGDGNVYYSDLPPPEGARNVTSSRVHRVEADRSLPYELQAAVQNYPVSVYVSPDCGDLCKSASKLLIERGVPHTLLDATIPEINVKLQGLTNGRPAVPVAEVGEIVLQGFEEGRWNSALDTAGYPRHALIKVTPTIPTSEKAGVDEMESDSEDDDGSDDFESDDFYSSDEEFNYDN